MCVRERACMSGMHVGVVDGKEKGGEGGVLEVEEEEG